MWYGTALSLLVALGGATLELAGHVCQGWELSQVISGATSLKGDPMGDENRGQ